MHGRIELICGPMFSGKTTAMIDRLTAAHRAGFSIIAVKPLLDTRYDRHQIVSHDGRTLSALRVSQAEEIRAVSAAVQVLGIDEVHFFTDSLVTVCQDLATAGLRIVAAGVELDHRGQPFETIARFKESAHEVTQLAAKCARCGAPARQSQRLAEGSARIIVGGIGMYEPRCDRCFEPGGPAA